MSVRSNILRATAIVAALLALGSGAASVRSDDLRSIIVLREDDLRQTWRLPFPEFGNISAYEYCKNNQIPITWGAITSLADAGNHGLTWAELKQYLSAAGGEVASHSVNHRAMWNTDAYINELTASKAAVEAGMGPGYVCRAFLQPGGWTDDANMNTVSKLNSPIGQAIQSTYESSMAYLGGVWRTGSTYYKYGLTNTFSIDYSSLLSVDGVNATLDIVADSPGTVLIVSCHGVQPTGGTTLYEVPANVLKAFVEKVVALRTSNKIRLMGLSDAYSQVFPQDINHIPSIDVCNPPADETPAGPWKLSGDAHMSPDEGRGGGKCLKLAVDNAEARCGWLTVRPGRYEVAWYQRVVDGFQDTSGVRFNITNYLGSACDPRQTLINNAWFFNQQPCVWEQKKTLFLIREMEIPLIVSFLSTPYSGASSGCLIDDVSLIHKPVDTTLSPSNFRVAPSPTGGTATFDTPDDPDITSMEIRYGTLTHPLDGTNDQRGTQPNILLCNVAPLRGQKQTVPFVLDWQSGSNAYFSAFARRGDAYSDPDIDYVVVPVTGPSVTITNSTPAEDGHATVTWSVQSAAPANQTLYALGRSAGAEDVRSWTAVPGTSVEFDVPSTGLLYVSVKTQDVFGRWSNVASRHVTRPITIAKETNDSDIPVTVDGVVSAVFSDCFYLEAIDRSSAIRVTGGGAVNEGDYIAVRGNVSTEDGERVLQQAP